MKRNSRLTIAGAAAVFAALGEHGRLRAGQGQVFAENA